MKINGHKIEPDTAWVMRNGRIAIITETRHELIPKVIYIKGFTHVASDGRPGWLHWNNKGEATFIQTSDYDLIKPLAGSMKFITFKESS